MASSLDVDTERLHEWRDRLRSINFWLDGYLNSPAYQDLEGKLDRFGLVMWNVGVGPTACFTRAISSIAREAKIKRSGPFPFDHVIEVDMKRAAAQLAGTRLSINDKLHLEVAEQLGLLHQEYGRLKEMNDELQYYTYGRLDESSSLEQLSRLSVGPQIIQKLVMKRYLLVVENLDEPIKPINLSALTEGLCFPAPEWKDSFWCVSTTTQDVYGRSKPPDYSCLIESYSGEDTVILTLYSLHQAAKYILGAISGHKDDEQYWHRVAVQCFHYATMLLLPHCHCRSSSSHHGDAGGQQQSCAAGLADDIITSDELIRQWSAQGFLVIDHTERTEETSTGSCSSSNGNYNNEDIYQVGKVILEAFREYSLLPQLPLSLSPATTTEKAEEEEEATKSAAHFLACHELITAHHTTDEICEGSEHPAARLERMQWILHVGDGDQGWHLNSSEWLSDRASSGPTTLILRHCSQQSRLLAKLDYLLAKLPSLHVLDLSYSSVESLPPSVFCLQKLQFLSLRGCYNMTNPFGFFSSDTTDDIITTPLPAGNNNSNTQIIGSLLYLDLSYSNVKTFHCDFFRRMPNLQELLLLKCSNLEELPPSITALSSLEKLELRGTQIKSFPGKMFEDMKKLASVKIIENKELLFAPAGLISEARELTDLHIEGCESMIEVEVVTLERHPTLRSFSFIGAPHMKRLSLRGCRKLEYVDIMEVGALEELDLSATAIKELPDSIPNLPKLRRLLLMGVPSLKRFPWHKLERLPDVFCLDQCTNRSINRHSDHSHVARQVCIISDSRLFYSFNNATWDLIRDGKLLKTFYVRVASCKITARKMHQDGEDMVITNTTLEVAPPAYDDVNHRYLTAGVSMVSIDDVPTFRETERHVEISAADQYPHGLNHLLQVTKSISMWDDTHVSCLNDLSRDLDELEECKLRWCHKTAYVFINGIPSLKNAYVSHLKSLTHFHGPWYSDSYFNALKHLVLEDCPRLEDVVPRGCELPSLETLDILFCYNLKAIFYYHHSYSSYQQLPCLRRIRLQELPLLEHLHEDDNTILLTAPAWEELHVRGCCSLRRLPRLSRQQPAVKVKVSGERAWWAKLRWDLDSYERAWWAQDDQDQDQDQDHDDDAAPHRDSYEPRLSPTFASHRERVVIDSYLR